jgi:hypothetical protein
MKLVVTHAFGDFAIGDEITDADTIEAILAERPQMVVKVADPAQADDA